MIQRLPPLQVMVVQPDGAPERRFELLSGPEAMGRLQLHTPGRKRWVASTAPRHPSKRATRPGPGAVRVVDAGAPDRANQKMNGDRMPFPAATNPLAAFKPLFSILLFYLALLLVLFVLQRNLIYFPGRHSPAALETMSERLGLTLWPENQGYLGLMAGPPGDRDAGTVLVFHGNAGSAINRSYYFAALNRLGYRVIVAEYPGYGARPGAPSESALIADGIAVARRARADFGDPLFLWGESLGGGVVGGIVNSGKVPIGGIVLLTPFDSMANVAQHHYWFLLAHWLIHDRFDNLAYLQGYTGNAAILIAEHDRVIPNRYSLNLYESLQGNKRLWTFEDADHNTLPLAPHLPWWQEVMDFIGQEKR